VIRPSGVREHVSHANCPGSVSCHAESATRTPTASRFGNVSTSGSVPASWWTVSVPFSSPTVYHVAEASSLWNPESSWANDAIVAGAALAGRHCTSSTPVSVQCAMIMVSVNPGTASPRGTSNPIVSAGWLVVVVGGGRTVVDTAAVVAAGSVDGTLEAADSAPSGDSVGAGERRNQPSAKAATTTPTTPAALNRRDRGSAGGNGRNSGSIVT
jgi:hypothetical protein